MLQILAQKRLRNFSDQTALALMSGSQPQTDEGATCGDLCCEPRPTATSGAAALWRH